ncbi:uncharacterized protein LOC135843869 [Planococcus citri]|uniref:uncharacterized protein LOC135843869 n=1 Tax=Planococcus citri TaxID=170843 RepID=UPI0031F78AB2
MSSPSLELEPLCNFRRNPSSLAHLASIVSAAMLTRPVTTINPTKPPVKLRNIVELPLTIERKIDHFTKLVKQQISSWCRFYDENVFFDRSCDPARGYFDVLVWSDDGTVNYEETAREMLKQDNLSAEEKYRIACNHCLKNVIRKLRLNLKTEVNMVRAKHNYPLVYYWEYLCRNGKTIAGLSKHILNMVVFSGKFYPACAVDYFLHRLNLEKRSDFFHSRYEVLPFKSLEKFLMRFSNEELLPLMTGARVCGFMKEVMVKYWMHADFLLQVWIRIQDIFSEFYFRALMKTFVLIEVTMPVDSIEHASLAVEIFNHSPFEYRLAVFKDYIDNNWWTHYVSSMDVRLDIAVLSTSPERYEFWIENWSEIFFEYPADCFEQFMKVCCKNQEGGCEEFKVKVMNNSSLNLFLCVLLEKMQISKLNDFFNVFSSDSARIMRTKQNMLRYYFLEDTYTYERKLLDFPHLPQSNELIDFIEGSFENDPVARDLKRQVLESATNCCSRRFCLHGKR